MDMDQRQEEEIFHAARDIESPAERAAYLDRVCGENTDLRRCIEPSHADRFAIAGVLSHC